LSTDLPEDLRIIDVPSQRIRWQNDKHLKTYGQRPSRIFLSESDCDSDSDADADSGKKNTQAS